MEDTARPPGPQEGARQPVAALLGDARRRLHADRVHCHKGGKGGKDPDIRKGCRPPHHSGRRRHCDEPAGGSRKGRQEKGGGDAVRVQLQAGDAHDHARVEFSIHEDNYRIEEEEKAVEADKV